MSALEEARRLIAPDAPTVVSNPEWRKLVTPLVDLIDDALPHAASEIARRSIVAMGDDNGVRFTPTEDQDVRLRAGMTRMMLAGCIFNDAQIELWATGEHTEMLAVFERFDGFAEAQQAMNDIFDGLGNE